MKDFRTVTLADQVFERLESDIIQGVYPRGEVLTELRLVEQLNVSRTPIREALRRLEQEHLIADTGKGTVVLGITAEDLVDIMDIRCKIEGLASYYAAKNATPDGLARLQHILDLQEFYFEKRDAEHLREMDDQFHDIICDMSGHAVISDTLVPAATARRPLPTPSARHRWSKSTAPFMRPSPRAMPMRPPRSRPNTRSTQRKV